jgi:hypothetical protein
MSNAVPRLRKYFESLAFGKRTSRVAYVIAGQPIRFRNGMAESLDEATVGFRKALRHLGAEMPDRVFARL